MAGKWRPFLRFSWGLCDKAGGTWYGPPWGVSPPLMAADQDAIPLGPSYRRVTSDELVDHRHDILSYGLTSRLFSASFQAI